MASTKKTTKKQPQAVHSTVLLPRFTAHLLRLRKRAELSQAQLAARTGLSVSYISMLERGAREPTLATVERVAGAFGLEDPNELMRKA